MKEYSWAKEYFTGESDGREKHIGRKTTIGSDDHAVLWVEDGVFDKKGKLHSFDGISGRFEQKNGYKFDGEWSHAEKHGNGVETLANGYCIVRGRWKNGLEDGFVQIQRNIDGRNARMDVSFHRGKMNAFGKVSFLENGAIYIGELSIFTRPHPLHGKGILLDDSGIHVGMWREDQLIGIEKLHLCDEAGTVIELERKGCQVVEIGRSIGNPCFRVEGEGSPLAALQKHAVAVYLGKKRTLCRMGWNVSQTICMSLCT